MAVQPHFAALTKAASGLVNEGQDVFIAAALASGLVRPLGAVDYFMWRAHVIAPGRRAETGAELLLQSGRPVSSKDAANRGNL